MKDAVMTNTLATEFNHGEKKNKHSFGELKLAKALKGSFLRKHYSIPSNSFIVQAMCRVSVIKV